MAWHETGQHMACRHDLPMLLPPLSSFYLPVSSLTLLDHLLNNKPVPHSGMQFTLFSYIVLLFSFLSLYLGTGQDSGGDIVFW